VVLTEKRLTLQMFNYMANVKMPSLGENVKEGRVISVLVKPGDIIAKGQTLIEVETDKVTFEVPSETSGELVEFFVKIGDVIQSGALLGKVDEKISSAGEKAEQRIQQEVDYVPPPKEDASQEFIGTSLREQKSEFSDEKNGLSLMKETKRVLSTPLARKLARELDIEISEVGNSINKRITYNDVKVFTKERIKHLSGNKLQSHTNINIPLLPHFEKFGNVRRQEMTAVMVATSRNMIVSASSIPHAWLHEKIDITDLETHRKKHKGEVEMAGGNLTITALTIKAVASALQKFPLLNCSIDVGKNEIIIKEHYHIGVAVDTDRGLLVPVIRDVDKRSLTSIAIELARVSKEVRDRKTKPEDLEGATFTISNLGGIGTTGMNPIVNWPQVAILGLSASSMEPVWIDNEFVARLRVPFSLGFDHRVVNGGDAARFLRYLKSVLEDPFSLLL